MKWIDVKDELPKKTGRYFILITFDEPVVCNERIEIKRIPFVSNFNRGKGWTSQMPGQTVTHWMEVPKFS